MLVKLFSKHLFKLHSLVRYSTTINPFAITLNTKFSSIEEEKILNTLNNADAGHLACLMPATRMKTLQSYKSRKGFLTNINEILEVDGFSVKNSEQLCKKIISNELIDPGKQTNGNKRTKSLLTPSLQTRTGVFNVVGIHVAPTGVSWAKVFHEKNEIHAWGYHNLALLPKKMLPTDTFRIALDILKQLPRAEIYIFEGNTSMGPQGTKPSATVVSFTQQQELIAMLLTLINTSPNHNTMSEEDGWLNKVYFLKSRIPARLFKTLVGNECVSSVSVISQLLQESSKKSLPCDALDINADLKDTYLKQTPPDKELMGHSLMLAVAFVELILKKNQLGLDLVFPNRR